MKITPDCVPCLMKRILFQARLLDSGCESDCIKAAVDTFSKEYDTSRSSASVATEVHRAAYNIMGADPYKQMKIDADNVAAEFLDYVTNYVDTSDDSFAAALRVAVIGNIMDFGVSLAIDNPEQFRYRFKDLLDQGIGADDTEILRNHLKNAKKVAYFFDNCGESQFDKLLIKEIQKMGVKVTGVVRGEAILNDVTLEDAERIGLDKILDKLITTGTFAIGVDLSKAGEDLLSELSEVDLIISKGMANYESISDQKVNVPIVYILRTKCEPVAKSLGVPADINVVKMID